MLRPVRRLPSPPVPSSSQEVIFSVSEVPDISLISPLPVPARGGKGHGRNTSSIDSTINQGEDGDPLLQRNDNDNKAIRNLGNYRWRQSSQHSRYPPWPPNTAYTNAKSPEQYQLTNDDTGQYTVVEQSPMSRDFPESTLTLGFTPNVSGRTSKQHPFAKDFEPPDWRLLAIHAVLCGLAYPFILVFVILAQERSLFWTRFFVGVGCGLSGALLGWSLLGLARGVLEASTWATLIHQSHVSRGGGVRLKDLAAQCDNPYSAVTGLRLLWDRRHYPGADIEYRRGYDSRRWTIFVLFFLANVALAGVLPFLFGRIVDIQVRVTHQYDQYYEVAVQGDLSDEDIQRASNLQKEFENVLFTWTLAPFSVHSGLTKAVSFSYRDDPVYFSEVIPSQLLPNGSGLGTFKTDTTDPSIDPNSTAVQGDPMIGLEPGSILRFPRWGIRIKCAKVPNVLDNIIPSSGGGSTYLFTPRDTIRALFSALNVTFLPTLEQPLNVTGVMSVNDTLPPALNISQMALGAKFSNNGVAHSMKSTPQGNGENGTGFVTMENILVRLNSSYAPNGSFPTQPPNGSGKHTFIEYDAAVCLELYEPWVLEVYNSSVGFPTSVAIVDKGAEIRDKVAWERRKGKKLDDPRVKVRLNSTNLWPAYVVGHQNSVNQMVKDNGRDAYYVPSPMLISFTSGEGPRGYTVLSEVFYAKARALADASNVLPYFAGSALSLARCYPDKVVASAFFSTVEMAILMVIVFLAGLLSALFVPSLPLDAPRRGFDLYSWMSAFYASELVVDRSGGISKRMELEEMQRNLGEVKFRYAG